MKSVKLASVAGLALLLAACGGKGESTSEPTGEATASASDTAAPASSAAPETPSAAPAATATPSPAPAPSTSAAVAIAASADAPVGFNQCKVCHSVKPGDNGIGPSLAGIYNTVAGKVPNYDFSTAMAQSGLKWDAKTLDTYLTDPRALVPGTKMSFAGLKDDAKRKEVVAYLKTLK